MKILLTGSSGFIGSHMTARLDSTHTLYHLQSDLLDFEGVAQEVAEFAPDVIVHLAARTEVETSFYEQVSFSQVNYVGTVNLIEAASKLPNLQNFVFASTMEVYGWQPISDDVEHNTVPAEFVAFDENTIPNPNAPYAVAKLACEKYLEYAHRALGLPFTAIRQTNSYGRKDNNFFVTEQIITQMLAGNTVNLGYAEPYRNFIYIDDLLDAWQTVIENPANVVGKILTIGPDDPIKIRDYADKIAAMLDWQGTINWDTKPARPGEIYWLNSTHSKITELTGWAPRVSLDVGLQRTIDFWRTQV